MNFQPKLKEVEMKNMVKNICAAMVISLCAAGHLSATENNPNNDNKFMEENLNLIQEWDKTFPQSDKVDHKKILSTTVTALHLPPICMYPRM